jgi:uncharacterized membrane protein YkgB
LPAIGSAPTLNVLNQADFCLKQPKQLSSLWIDVRELMIGASQWCYRTIQTTNTNLQEATMSAVPHTETSIKITRLITSRRFFVDAVRAVGVHLTRYGLVIVFLWIGAMKFTNYEAEGIRPFVENSPLMSWLYQIFSVRQFSTILGIAEIAVGLLIATRSVWPRVSACASSAGAGIFLGTLSFIVSTPGWEPTLGFPALSIVGQFLLKDLVLLGASIWTAAEALQATEASE